MTEARLEDAGSGLTPITGGWSVVNVRDAEWFTSETTGAACWFANEYGDTPVEFPQLGINVTVLAPGQSGVEDVALDEAEMERALRAIEGLPTPA